MTYIKTKLKRSIDIDAIITLHYFEYMKNFEFKGESHNFWEFLYVDKGTIAVRADDTWTTLKTGDIIFHQPNEFHAIKSIGKDSPNLVVMSFTCDSPAMDFFIRRNFTLSMEERSMISQIITEARQTFSTPMHIPSVEQVELKDNTPFASQQMIKLYLEHFLIHLIRRYSNPIVLSKKLPKADPPKVTKSNSDAEIFGRIVDYLESHLTTHVTIDQICKDNLIGRSQLQKIFKEHCSLGIIEYFSMLKINAAKELIRTNRMNFTQIAEHLGYTSIHYFSRQFKKVAGMTPSEYASSIKAMAEGEFK